MKNKKVKSSKTRIIDFLHKLSIFFLILLGIIILISIFIVDLSEFGIVGIIFGFFVFLLGTPKCWLEYKESKADGRWNLNEIKWAFGYPILAIGLLVVIVIYFFR